MFFYLNDYSKELRLNHDVSKKIFKEFKEANKSIYEIDKESLKRKLTISFIKAQEGEPLDDILELFNVA